MTIQRRAGLGFLAAIALFGGTLAAAAQAASVVMKNAEGKEIGSVNLTQTSQGVLINAALKGLPPGEHAFHVHAVGKCEPPFTSAGGHFNPGGRKHGMMSPEGQHAGDSRLERVTGDDDSAETLQVRARIQRAMVAA